jgi:hypothetical protein
VDPTGVAHVVVGSRTARTVSPTRAGRSGGGDGSVDDDGTIVSFWTIIGT